MQRRILEIIPGGLSWATLILVVILSWQKPVWISIFIILFDLYWLLKSIYFSLHLRATFNQMRRNLKVKWREKLNILANWQSIYHLVILPMATEPYEVVKETFESLAATNYPKDKLILVLAIEERTGPTAEKISERIFKEFSGIFPSLLITKHPANLPGEIPGKGSNETYAAKEAQKSIIDKREIPHENIVVSVFDVDTQIYPE